ncbi:MAG: glycosyltransferase family 4 protein [Patescibacteria group bacterium]
MKKILILNHNQENFGTYYRCLFLGRGLSSAGYKVRMLCASGRKFDLRIRRKCLNDNFELITLPRIKYGKYFTGQIGLRLPIMALYALFSQYDICYAFTVAQPQVGIPALMAKAIKKKKLVVDWDDLWGNGFANEHQGQVGKILSWSERYFIKFADKITYVSELIGSEIDKLNLKIEKIKIPNGANVEEIKVLDKVDSRKELGLNLEKKYLVSVGNTYTDSLGIMFEALEESLQKISDLTLVLVGEGKIEEKFKSLFDKLGHNIIQTGKRPFLEIPLYLAAADVLLLPMDDNNIERARFPMRFGDYLCAGRPIVSNAVGEVKYYLEKYNAGLASSVGEVSALAGNIQKIINDDYLAEEVSKNARALAQGELNWTTVNHKLINIFNAL